MMKFCIFIGLVVVVAIGNANANTINMPAQPEKIVPAKDLAVEVIIAKGKKLETILEKYPNAIELQRTARQGTSQINGRDLFEYTLGNRVSGDYLVSQANDNINFIVASDVQLTLDYPAQGTGAIVTYVSILVDQSSSYGRAYVVNGGIGYRYISIIVEAEYTYWFGYNANIFGY